MLCENWKSVKPTYFSPPQGVKPSQLAAGLEQGLREYSLILGGVGTQYRVKVAKLFHETLQAEYPSFLSAQEDRLSKILERGHISSESQFMLVRHAIDVEEGDVSDPSGLQKLYLLIDRFQAKGR